MIDIKVKRTAPELVFEKSIFDNTEKYKTAQNMGAYFIGLILMKMNIGLLNLMKVRKMIFLFAKILTV